MASCFHGILLRGQKNLIYRWINNALGDFSLLIFGHISFTAELENSGKENIKAKKKNEACGGEGGILSQDQKQRSGIQQSTDSKKIVDSELDGKEKFPLISYSRRH